MVKDLIKPSYGRPFFVCSDKSNRCSFWVWGDVQPITKPECRHGFPCVICKVKKVSTRIVYSFAVLRKIHANTSSGCLRSLITMLLSTKRIQKHKLTKEFINDFANSLKI